MYLFLAVLVLVAVRATLYCSGRVSHHGVYSRCGAQAPGTEASVVAGQGLSSWSFWVPEHEAL